MVSILSHLLTNTGTWTFFVCCFVTQKFKNNYCTSNDDWMSNEHNIAHNNLEDKNLISRIYRNILSSKYTCP